MNDQIILGNFEAVHELTENDNFHTSIYEHDYDGLLIARCNQNGAHPHQVTAILNGLNGKQASAELIAQYASRISQQDAELDRMRRELAAERESVADLAAETTRLTDAMIASRLAASEAREQLAEARKAAFIEAAEMSDAIAKQLYQGELPRGVAEGLAAKFREKAEETGR